MQLSCVYYLRILPSYITFVLPSYYLRITSFANWVNVRCLLLVMHSLMAEINVMHLCFFFLGKVNCAEDDNMQRFYSYKRQQYKTAINHDEFFSHPDSFFFRLLKWCKIALFSPLSMEGGVFESIWSSFVNKASRVTIWDRSPHNKLLSPFTLHLSPSINIPRTHIVAQLASIKRKKIIKSCPGFTHYHVQYTN